MVYLLAALVGGVIDRQAERGLWLDVAAGSCFAEGAADPKVVAAPPTPASTNHLHQSPLARRR